MSSAGSPSVVLHEPRPASTAAAREMEVTEMLWPMLFFVLGPTAPSEMPSGPAVLASSIMAWEDIEAAAKCSRRQVFQAPTATLDELEVHVTVLAPGQTRRVGRVP